MDLPVVSLPDFNELRSFVRATLCDYDRMLSDQVTLRQGVIRASGRACGLFFQLNGPQRQRSYAVWAADEHRIIFYNAAGVRTAEARLSDSPDAAGLERKAA